MSAVDWSAPFEQLQAGQTLRTRGRTVTEADIVGFAALTGDWHPQHADASWAAESRFGERIAHGMLILSYAVGLMPFDPERVVALRRVTDVVFKRPLKIGETIGVDGTIAELSPLDEQVGLVGCAWSVRNQDRALICRARMDVLWRRGRLPAVPGGESSSSSGDPVGERTRPVSGVTEASEGQSPLDYASGVFPC